VPEISVRRGHDRRTGAKGRRDLAAGWVKAGRWEVLLDEPTNGLREVSRSALPLGEPMMELPDPKRGHQTGKQQTSYGGKEESDADRNGPAHGEVRDLH
jgi:hypothetical protein